MQSIPYEEHKAEKEYSMDQKPYQIVIFGKAGCPKCHALNQRIDKMLKKGEWTEFSKSYHDILTESGLVEFCNVECINPQRIPAMIVKKYNISTKEYEYIFTPTPRIVDTVCRNFKLYTYLGVQTDYTTTGTITPKMIRHILETAKAL